MTIGHGHICFEGPFENISILWSKCKVKERIFANIWEIEHQKISNYEYFHFICRSSFLKAICTDMEIDIRTKYMNQDSISFY